MINFENLDKAFPGRGVGKYNIPQIKPVYEYHKADFIHCHYAYTAKEPENKIVHFFDEDYQFIRYWNNPDKYIPRLSKFRGVLSPDFSMYTDMPLAMQIYNHYRKHWLAMYWQKHGITVYPTIGWSTPDSYEWCFDGEPKNSIVAVSSVGVMRDKECRRLFFQGYEEMMKRLAPTQVIFYGTVPKELDWNVIRVDPQYMKYRK